ncbi:hypothetical protein ABTX99_27900 [Streptomyces flaveolus]|uniref:Uncharacterized protein n=1 Tax=Streptomyces plicatus TaxID=1922 RepID=A0ABW1Y4B8_STRPL|nr:MULTISPECIES: hypothetical protein [Streptomyces]MBJ6622220.1 hypothetical protein [Streptomyces sp. DHE17-7]GGZ88907.1 hypothetical protein GCM10010301_71530 [Streptomyces plicatus]GHC45293.1 hypothetical protein GCM10010308_75540 [Streptomyces vinaceusdrappus]
MPQPQLHTRTAASTVDFGEVVPLTVDPLIALDNAVVLSCTFQLSPPK